MILRAFALYILFSLETSDSSRQLDCWRKCSPFLHPRDPRRKGGSLYLYLQLITKQKYEDKVFSIWNFASEHNDKRCGLGDHINIVPLCCPFSSSYSSSTIVVLGMIASISLPSHLASPYGPFLINFSTSSTAETLWTVRVHYVLWQ